jgi:hypothetical protein
LAHNERTHYAKKNKPMQSPSDVASDSMIDHNHTSSDVARDSMITTACFVPITTARFIPLKSDPNYRYDGIVSVMSIEEACQEAGVDL